jgi:hypothetical protein
MIVIASLCAAILIVGVFTLVHGSYARGAAITGTVWLVMNREFDLIVLVGLSGMPRGEYFVIIGLRDHIIPTMVIPAGIILDRALEWTGNQSMGSCQPVYEHTAYYTLTADIVAQLYKRLYEK